MMTLLQRISRRMLPLMIALYGCGTANVHTGPKSPAYSWVQDTMSTARR